MRLNRQWLLALHDLMDALEKTPSETAREQELVLAIQNNLVHLCNLLRPAQARATLKHTLTQSAQQKQELVQRLRQDSDNAATAISDSCSACAAMFAATE